MSNTAGFWTNTGAPVCFSNTNKDCCTLVHGIGITWEIVGQPFHPVPVCLRTQYHNGVGWGGEVTGAATLVGKDAKNSHCCDPELPC